MLEWNEIKGINNDMNYMGNVENGVILPELEEEVLFCMPNYKHKDRDMFFSGYIDEDRSGLSLVDLSSCGETSIRNGVKWARFNKPETENNIEYAIAYLDENDNGFKKDIPNIVKIEKDEVDKQIGKLYRNGYSRITVFKYIKPCTFEYDWEYIKAHKV